MIFSGILTEVKLFEKNAPSSISVNPSGKDTDFSCYEQMTRNK